MDCGYTFALFILFQYAAQSASCPSVLIRECVSVAMLEILEPASLYGFQLGDNLLHAFPITASSLLSDIISELHNTLVGREFHPLLEFVSQKFKDFFVGIDYLGLGGM